MTIGVLLFTWLVGQRILTSWDARKKRREIEFEIEREFQRLYGKFKEIWRIWKTVYDCNDSKTVAHATTRFELLQAAARAEGGIESIVIRLATNRELLPCQIESLGLFRQSYQTLRESIRDNEPMNYSHKNPAYLLLNRLAAEVSSLLALGVGKSPPSAPLARSNLKKIAFYRSKEWKAAVAREVP